MQRLTCSLDGLTRSSSGIEPLASFRLDLDPRAGLARATEELLKRRRSLAASQQNKQAQEKALELRDRALEATRDPYLWATQYTQTYNEHWVEEGRPSPYEPFPSWPYIADVFELLDAERIFWWIKSRDMMLSWCCVAYLTWNAMIVPERGVLFQTQKEDKARQLVKYAKTLYERQPEWLRDAFPLSKPLRAQPDLELRFAHGGRIIGIPGGADQIRSYHPWGYLNDESSFQPEAGECYNEALSAVKGKIIFNSSAGPGWYADARRDIIRNDEG